MEEIPEPGGPGLGFEFFDQRRRTAAIGGDFSHAAIEAGKIKGKYAVVPLPGLKAGGIAPAFAGGNNLGVLRSTSHRTLAVDLMEELAKVRRVLARQAPGAPHETLLTIDATTGQNGLRQAKLFADAVDVSGIVLTKLDGTAKGGVALAIASEVGIPVKLIGVGEQLEDLRPFDADEFARALLE